MQICKKCNAEISEQAIYCSYCGHKCAINKTRSPKKRGNGQGTAYKLPNGSWGCEITKYINGQRKRCRKKGFKTKKDALLFISELSINKKKSKTITIAEAYMAIAPSLEKLSEKRKKTYESAYKSLESVELCDIKELELTDLQNIIDDIDGGFYKKRYVKDLLNKLFSIAFVDGKIDRNIVPYIVLPKNEGASEKTIYTKSEINILWNQWNNGNEMAGLLLITLYCGIRTGELWSIRCDSVSFITHTMYGGIKTTKGKLAPIFISEPIEPVIRYFVNKDETYFYNKSPVEFYRAWRKFKKEVGFREELQPYCGRHSCTSVLTEAGLPEAVIMQVTRHTKYDTTLMYTHIDTESVLHKVNEAVKKI